MDKFLIVGLGNPGEEYKNTKHNMGFLVLDHFSKKNNFTFSSNMYNGIFYKFIDNDKEIFVLKPLTYMNLSGECVLDFINFYKIKKENILVIYDDLDMNFGKIKLKEVGSSGGQNGIKNIINKLGTENIKRLKIGIGRPINKNHSISNYVLSKINEEEKQLLKKTLEKSSLIIEDFYKKEFKKIMTEENGN